MFKQLKNMCRDRWLAFAGCESGVSAIEFAMVAPPAFLLLGVTIETGVMMFSQYTLQTAVETAARSIRTGSAQMNSVSSTNFKNSICNSVGSLLDCSKVVVYVRSDPTFAALVANTPPLLNIGPSTGSTTVSAPACYNPGNASQPAIIIATYDWYFVSWGMSAFGNVAGNKANRLIGLTLFQNQNYPGSVAGTC
ncbi:MAG TPA: TadE/TadG family type IV pilus assembly protein [Aestuariivirga sp.]|jgi:Flp pilus assembly protein TadG